MVSMTSSMDQERIIDTKLRPPLIRSRMLTREDLHDQIQLNSESGSLLSIIAPAGSGKTTLMVEIYQALESAGTQCHWLSVDSEDDDPAIFAKYLISSIYTLDESSSEKELAFLRANPARDFDAFFDSLIARISATNQKVAIFIDDFQNLSAPGILRFWDRLIAHVPSNIRLIIASRTKLQLDLSRRRISGTLIELDQHDLNFTLNQLVQFMQQLHSIELPADAAEMLHSSTEGWVAGLQLAALAIGKENGEPFEMIRSFSGRDKDLTEYLFQTVLRVQSREVRDFLLATSPLTRMSPGLCNAVTDRDDGAELLEIIENCNLFIVPLDREGKWFRYHHLFADFLQNELKKNDPDAFSRICEIAAGWCEQQGRITEAIQYYLSGKNYDNAANLIAEHAPDTALNNGDHYSILDWMRRLPDDYHFKRPEITLNHAWSRAFSRDLAMANTLTNEVLAGLDGNNGYEWDLTEEEQQHFRWLALVTQSIATVCADELLDSLESCNNLFRELPDTQPFLQAAILNAISYCHFARHEITSATRTSTDAYLYGKKAGSEYAFVWADFLNAIANIELGKIRSAEDIANRAIRNVGVRTKSNSYMFAMAALTKAEVETQRCNFHVVDRCLTVGKEFSSVFGPTEPLLVALRNEARLKAWKGELGAARKILNQGQDTALGTDQPRLYFTLVAEEIDLQLRYDDVSAAMETLRRTNLCDADQAIVTPDIKDTVVELGRMTQAKLLVAQDKNEEALKLITQMTKSVQPDQRVQLLLSLRTLKSVAHWKSGREMEAIRELDRVISHCAPEDHAYPIINTGDTVIEILEAIRKKRSDAYLGEEHATKHAFELKLLSLLKGERPETPSHNQSLNDGRELLEPLTERELEILKLIGAGLGNKQLADELLISVSTVKWHLHNVYEKIGVRSRTAAAAHARNMNLI